MNPKFIEDMSREMQNVYAAVTDRILINLAKHFPYIEADEQVKGGFNYQARMLAQMGQVNRETADIILDSLGGADAELRKALEGAITEALRTEEPRLQKAAKAGLLHGNGLVPPEATPNMMQAFKTYYKQSADKLNLVNTVMLESTEQAYKAAVSDIASKINRTQNILNTETGEVISGVTAYNTAMREGVERMVQNGLTGFIDHAGHHWTPESYVAMDIKTTMFNTAREAVWERNGEYGNDLYTVSSHNGARPLCYPWQGKVISTSGRTGKTTDLDGNEIVIHSEDEIESFRYGGGLFGVNCGHYPMVFIPGVSKINVQPQDQKENAESYAESQKQRALERKLREEKRDLEIMKAQGAPAEDIADQKLKVRKASADIDSFCDETGRTRKRANEYTPVNASFDGADYDLLNIIESGAKKTIGWENQHAKRYYEEVRNRKPYVDAKKISKYTDFSEYQIEDIRQHMFIREQPLENGTVMKRFAPDYDQAVAWQRLISGKGTETDVLMLKHEYLELTLMRNMGYNYDEAHKIANQQYNWWAEVLKNKEE